MKIFGFNITRGAAPNLPSKNTDGTLTEIMPPFGTNSPQSAISTISGGALDQRFIHSDPRELWYLNLPSKLVPAQVLQILRSALGGDIWQQWQLTSIMLDSWPMLRKCSHELREAVSQTQFKIDPFSVNGEEPTDTASEKADLVRRAFANMKPNQFTDEEDLSGAIYDFCDSMLNGLTVSEILWQTVKTKENGVEKYPRAICWVHPRHFTFTNDGMVAIYDSNYARTYYASADQNAQSPDPRKFICSQFKSRSGSSLGAGLMRPVAYDWSAVMFNREWMLKSAQTFGSPFVDVTYKPGTQPNELAKLDQEIAAGLANRFIRHVEGTTVNVSPAQAKTGQGNNQMMLMELADKHVCELFLGSEGTTKMTPGKMGGSQQNSSQENTKRERVEGLAKWVAAEPLQQLARAILLVNYGEDSECPTVQADFTEVQDPMEAATRMQVICGPNMPPIVADEYYDAMNLTKPEPGDQVISSGKIGLLGDTEQEIDPNPQQPEAPQPALDENNNPLPAQRINPNDAELQMKMAQSKVQGKHRGTDLKTLLGKASDSDIAELNELVQAAEQATHQNGEHNRVAAKIKELQEKLKA